MAASIRTTENTIVNTLIALQEAVEDINHFKVIN